MDTVMGRMGGKILVTFNLSFCNFIFARLLENQTALAVTKHLMILRTLFTKRTKTFSNPFPSFLPIMVESLPGAMTSKWIFEEKVNSSFVTLIALTRKGELRTFTRWFATFYQRELPLITSFKRTSISSVRMSTVSNALLWMESQPMNSLPLLTEKGFLSFLVFLKYLQKTAVNLLNYFNIGSKNEPSTPFKRLTLTSTIAELNLKCFQMRGFCALFFRFLLATKAMKSSMSKTSGT